MNYKNYFITFFVLFHAAVFYPTYAQEYIFVGDPAIVIEEGTYKQNFNTGMYFYHKHQWEFAIEFFVRCSELTRKKVKHVVPLIWSYIYEGEYSQAISSLSILKDMKEKRLIRLVLKEVNSRGKKKKLSKNVIDRIVVDKKDLIKRTRINIIAMSKHEIIDFGP